MANTNNPFGLKPVRRRGGAAYHVEESTPFYVPSTYATALFIGDPVIKTGTSNTASVTAPGAGLFPPGTLPEINKATAGAGNAITGVIVGFAADPAGLDRVHNPASTARVVYVATDPDLVYEVQASAGLAVTDVANNADLTFATAGSATTGLSGVQLDSANIGTGATKQVKILRVVNRDNVETGTNAKVEVLINNSTEMPGTAGI